MNLNYIREFCALAELRKFSEAAEVSFISQSALSKHIKSLEEELGSPLFYRTAHCVILTEFGEAFLPYAKDIGEIALNCENNLLNKTNFSEKALSVALSPSASLKYIFKDAQEVCLKKLGFPLDITVRHDKHLKKLLTTGKCDLIITTDLGNDDNEDFIVNKLYSDSFSILSYAPFKVEASFAESISYIQVGPHNYYGSVFARIRHPNFTAPDMANAIELLQLSGGFMIIPSQVAASYQERENFYVYPLGEKHKLTYYMVYLQSSLSASANLKSFIKLLSINN